MLNIITQAHSTGKRLAYLPMETLAERLRWALAHSGLKKIDLAKACGITRAAVGFWFSGQTQALEGANLTNAARALGVSAHWLATGRGQRITKRDEPNVTYGITIAGPRHIPVISYIQAGKWREIVDAFPPGGADEYVQPCNEHSRATFALRVVGTSMLPTYTEGDIIIVDPEVAPHPGDFVVARNHREEATFKKYRPRGRNADGVDVYELVPLNEDYETLRSDLDQTTIIGTVMEHIRITRR